MRALVLLLLLSEVTISYSQTTNDVDFMKSSPLGCFSRGYEMDYYIPNTNINTTSLKLCQEHCQYVPGCVRFVYKAFWGECWFADENAVEIPSGSPYLIAGYKSCEPEAMTLPPRCRTEIPGNGFPGYSGKSSDLAWPGGKQPYNLECWPKRWDGAPLACTEINVLEDTTDGWPGKCRGLVEIKGVNGTDCGRDCRSNPSCQSWQNTVYYSCWQGLGKDCFVRSNFVPRSAQRLQHGSIRVLKDLTGYQIKGLTKGFDNAEGFFQKQEDAIVFCKNMCYSDIRCQYWLYAPNYGCYLEDASQEDGPPYPLTVHSAMRDTGYAKDCVAGEYIQHYCPAESVSRVRQMPLPILADCAERGYRYEPPSMFLSHRSVEPNWEACRSRCKLTVYCNYFAFWPDGGCLVAGTDSQRVVAESYEVISGPIHCNASFQTPPPSVERWVNNASGAVGRAQAMAPVAGVTTDVSSAHMAEIEIPILGLNVQALAPPDKHLLEGRYADAIAKTIGVPVTEIKEGPDSNDLDAQVHLSPSVGGGCILTAYTPNEPVTSQSPALLASKLKVPALITNLKVATTQVQLPVMALEGGQIQVGEPQVGTKDHPLKGLQQEPSFWSQWWPLLIALTFAVCIGGFLFVHYFANQADRDDGKRKRLRVSGRGVSDEDAVELPLKEGLESGLPPPPPMGVYSGAPSSASYTSSQGYTPQYQQRSTGYGGYGGSGRYGGYA